MNQAEEVKQKVDIVSLIGEYVPLKKAGRNFKANCPFHQEKTPSFMVSPELQMYKCFGCGESGDAFTFLEKYEGMDFPEALKFLADRVGVKLVSLSPQAQGEKEKMYAINNQALRFYQYFLLSHPLGKKALEYLTQKRNLSLDTIKTFKMGFSPNIHNALGKYLIVKKKYNPFDVEKSGVGYKRGSDLVDRFKGRIIFPLFDHRGEVVGFSGRLLPDDTSEMGKYINSPESPIYHKSYTLFGLNLVKEAIKKEGYAIVVEGELDMISPWQAGFKNIVAIKGSALTEEQVRLLLRFTRKIVLSLDSDAAGDNAARRGISVAQSLGLDISVCELGEYKDPDDAVRADPEFFKKCIENSINVWDFLINLVFKKYDATSGSGKAQISLEVIPILSSIPDKIVQAHYIGKVSTQLGVPQEAVYEQIDIKKKDDEPVKVETKSDTPVEEEKTRKQLLEERLLALAFQINPKVLNDEKVIKLVSSHLTKRILDQYLEFKGKVGKFSVKEFKEFLPKELLAGFADVILKDVEDVYFMAESFQKEIDLVIRELEILAIRHRLEVLGVKIRQLEEKEESAKLEEFKGKFKDLTQKLSQYEQDFSGGIILQET